MRVSEAKDIIINLITEDIHQYNLDIVLNPLSPDGDDGKLLLNDHLVRVIHKWNGFHVKINPDWLTGSTYPPVIKNTFFEYYAFALDEQGVLSYYLCHYQKLRDFVLDFKEDSLEQYLDQNTWRGQIHIFENQDRGYFRWGDEDHNRLLNQNRLINLRNVADVFAVDKVLVSIPRSFKETIETITETEIESLRKSRIGQSYFREKLLAIWGGCSITGVNHPELLIASHVKPWRDSSNEQRLDPNNGLLLIPNLDKAFDCGLISFTDEGNILLSSYLNHELLEILGISNAMQLRFVNEGMKPYLQYHREKVFRRI